MSGFDRRVVRPRGNDSIDVSRTVTDGWPPATTAEQERIRAHIRKGMCPWCDGTRPSRRGPWLSIAGHVSQAHGIDRNQLRELAGLYVKSRVCSDEQHIRSLAQVRASDPLGIGQGHKHRHGHGPGNATSKKADTLRAARAPLFHGTRKTQRHGCKCTICRGYAQWRKHRIDKRPEPVLATRPCHPGCDACAAQLAVLGVEK